MISTLAIHKSAVWCEGSVSTKLLLYDKTNQRLCLCTETTCYFNLILFKHKLFKDIISGHHLLVLMFLIILPRISQAAWATPTKKQETSKLCVLAISSRNKLKLQIILVLDWRKLHFLDHEFELGRNQRPVFNWFDRELIFDHWRLLGKIDTKSNITTSLYHGKSDLFYLLIS